MYLTLALLVEAQFLLHWRALAAPARARLERIEAYLIRRYNAMT